MIVVTNRLPNPPIGGIPRFLSELAKAAATQGQCLDFVVPNRTSIAIGRRSQSTIESMLSSAAVIKDVALSTEDVRRSVESVGSGLIDSVTATSPQTVVVAPSLVAFTDVDFCRSANTALDHARDHGQSSTLLLLAPVEELDFYLDASVVERLVRRTGSVALHASRIAAPSSHAAAGWEQRLSMDVERLPLGIAPLTAAHRRARHERYIACERSGPLALHKNTSLIEAVHGLVLAKLPAEIVVVGGHNLVVEGLLVTPPQLSDIQLQTHYEASRAFLSLSKFEAFGFAGLEAMRAGTIPIVRTGTGLAETVSGAAIFLDAETDGELCDQAADAVAEILNAEKPSFDVLSERARAVAASFTAEAMFRSLDVAPLRAEKPGRRN